MSKYEKKTDELKFEVVVPSDNKLPISVRVYNWETKSDPREEYIIRSGVKHVDTDVATAVFHFVEEYLINKKKDSNKKVKITAPSLAGVKHSRPFSKNILLASRQRAIAQRTIHPITPSMRLIPPFHFIYNKEWRNSTQIRFSPLGGKTRNSAIK